MSIYAWLNCHDCCQKLWLGKVLQNREGIFGFHIGNDPTPHWQREELNKVIWKFLAEHTAHNISVLMENQMTEDFFGYQEIGGDGAADISVEEYLKDWKYKPDEP